VIDLPKNKTAGFKAVGFHQLRAMGCCAFGAPAENRPIPNVWSFAADGRSSAERDRFRTLHFQRSLRLEARVSFQITILKVLAGHPEGRVALADLRRAVGILISSGPDWTDRTKRLAARAPDLDIFSQALVLRDDTGWQITVAGRAFLASVETPIPTMSGSEQATESIVTLTPISAPPPIRPVGLSRRRLRRRAADRMRPSAA